MDRKLTVEQKVALRKAELRALSEPVPQQANPLVMGAALLGASRNRTLRRILLPWLLGRLLRR